MKLVIVLLALVCGAYSLTLHPKLEATFSSGDIIDGEEAQPGEAPFIVSIEFLGGHFCAGSIVDENTVVTAGHCLTYPASFLKVKAGKHYRSSNDGVQSAKVSKTIVHPGYDGGVGPNDIGIIKLATPFRLNTMNPEENPVDSIKLASNQEKVAGEGILYGWGMDRTNQLPDALQKLDTQIIGYSECKEQLPDNAPIERVNVCTKGENIFEGACNGDSGGPLVRPTASGPELVGIVSWGYTPCESSAFPSVYTSVAAFRDWIEKHR